MHKTPEPDSGGQAKATKRADDSYHLYFASGFYDRRYPSPNRTMWQRIEAFLGPDVAVLDFGCGSGRYLMRLQGRVARAVGYDISPTALATVRDRARAAGWADLTVLGPEPEMLDSHIETVGPVDLALCLFGVLGHITDPDDRAQALQRLHRAVRPVTGRLLISVPNRARRFRAEQAKMKSDLIRYQRQTEKGDVVELDYQLYSPEMLVAELAEAGFNLQRLGCESVLPESWLLHNSLLRWLDGLVTPWCPLRWGYGIYAEASC